MSGAEQNVPRGTFDGIALTQQLIRCRSVTPDNDGALEVVERALLPAGFLCRRLRFGSAASPSVDNLYARYGTSGPVLCFAGHTDVVPAGRNGAHPPFAAEIVNDILHGRGAVDMKGAIGAFCAAALEFIARGPFVGSIALLITGDEEGPAIHGTVKAAELLHAGGERWNAFLVGEPTNPERVGTTIKHGRRGSLSAVLTITGRQGHVAYPAQARNAAADLTRLLAALLAESWDEGTPDFPPTHLEITGIDAPQIAGNVIPGTASARFNLRFNPLHDAASLSARIQAVLRAAVTDADFDVQFSVGALPFLTPEHTPCIAQLREAVREITGITPVCSTDGGTSDARFLRLYAPTVEFGAVNATAHHSDEHISVHDLQTLQAVYTRFLEKFFRAE